MGTQDIVGFATDLIENKNEWVAEIDVQDYFDCISHDILLKNIHTIFSDEKLICFIASFIECKVESEEGIFLLTKGILQGMPLSPLLSNIFLMDFDKCLENKFTKRTRQSPEDALNAMISFGNTLLYNRFANEIYRSQLDIRFGILHSSLKNRESLNLDLADLFKPILVDRTIFTLVNKKMIHEVQDFQERENGGVYMNVRGKRIFIRESERKLYQKVNIDGSQKTYADLISLEVKKLQGFFLNNSGYKPFKYVN